MNHTNDVDYALVYLQRNWLARVLSKTRDVKLCPSTRHRQSCHDGKEDKDECYNCWLNAARDGIHQ